MMTFTETIQWIKLPRATLWGLLVACALMLWGPPSFVIALGLAEFIQAYRMYLGAAFLFFAVATVPNLIYLIFVRSLESINERRDQKYRIARLSELSSQEKTLLMRYLANGTKTVVFNIADGVAQGLADQEIIYRPSIVSQGGPWFAYNIQPWARRYLLEHPELLDISE